MLTREEKLLALGRLIDTVCQTGIQGICVKQCYLRNGRKRKDLSIKALCPGKMEEPDEGKKQGNSMTRKLLIRYQINSLRLSLSLDVVNPEKRKAIPP